VSLTRDVDVALAAAEAGAAVVRRCFGSALQRLEKGGGDFATSADVEAERAMVALVRRERSDDAILGEETGRSGPASDVRTWLIDALCGTHNYASGVRMVAVNVALEAAGRLTTAAVADPFADEIFWTDGAAAWQRARGHDRPLAPDASSGLVELNFDLPFPVPRASGRQRWPTCRSSRSGSAPASSRPRSPSPGSRRADAPPT